MAIKDIEVEIKFKIDRRLFVKIEREVKKAARAKGRVREVDTYFDSPLLNFSKSANPVEYLRLRKTDSGAVFAYKHPYFNAKGERTHSDEFETMVASPQQLLKILARLDLEKYLEIDKTRTKYQYGRFEIAFDQVKDLGYFIEIESHSKSKNVDQTHQKILDLAAKLGIDPGSQDTNGYVILRMRQKASKSLLNNQ